MPDKQAHSRHRSTEVGQVVSRAGNKTIVVQVTRRVQHSLYERYLNRRKNFHAHDEQNQCQVGDWVRIVESRPLSRQKRWRLETIIAKAAASLPPEPEAQPEAL
jgi:small subunit ribosomal protein S17